MLPSPAYKKIKMEHQPYFPNEIAKQRAWPKNYRAQISIDGPNVGLSPAQISDEEKCCDAMIQEIDDADAMQVAVTAKNKERDEMIAANMATLRPAIQTIKKNSGYTESIGKDLRLIGTEIVIDKLTVTTAMKLAKVPLGVDLKFTLEHCAGGNIYSKRAKESGYTFFKTVTHPHCIDTRSNIDPTMPEPRSYYVLLVINDLEVGIASPPQTINC